MSSVAGSSLLIGVEGSVGYHNKHTARTKQQHKGKSLTCLETRPKTSLAEGQMSRVIPSVQ